MRDAEKTVGNMIDKEKTIFVGSVDARRLSQHQGHVANPQKGRAQTHLPINEHLVDARFAISQK